MNCFVLESQRSELLDHQASILTIHLMISVQSYLTLTAIREEIIFKQCISWRGRVTCDLFP